MGPAGAFDVHSLTLCLVVLSRHVERLQFIDIMLGDKPALTPEQAAYQRMLTGDPVEAIEQAQEFLKDGKVTAYYEEVLIPALRLAQADAERGRLDDIRLENIFRTVSDLVEDLAEHGESDTALPELPSDDGKIVQLPTGDLGKPVYCLPGLGRLDDCGALIVADVLKRKGLNARVTGAETPMENCEVSTICICYLENVSKARLDYAVRKLSRQAPSARILVCLLTEGEQDAHASQPNPQRSHSLKATVAAWRFPKAVRVLRRGTNLNNFGSSAKEKPAIEWQKQKPH